MKFPQYGPQYLLSFSKWKICQEDKLLSAEVKKHLTNMESYEDEKFHSNKNKIGGNKNKNSGGSNKKPEEPIGSVSFSRKQPGLENKDYNLNLDGGMTKWIKKDLSKEEVSN
jgi:hypothetical protein